MDPGTLAFLIFLLVAALSVAAGWASVRLGVLDPGFGKPLHRFVVVWCWAAGGLMLIWKLSPELRHLWIVVIQAVCMMAGALAGVAAGKMLKLPRNQVAVLGIGAGVCNIGITLGAYLCYAMLPSPDVEGFVGLAVATLVTLTPLVIFPIAHRFAPHAPQDETLQQLMRRSLMSWTALPLYACLLGLVLSVAGVPRPPQVTDWYIIDVIFFATTIGAFFGIGLGLRADMPWKYGRQLLALSALTFLFIPLITWLMIQAMRWQGLQEMRMHPVAAEVMMIEAWMPAGVSTVMLANVFHLDSRMANSVWLWNTAAFTLLILPPLLWVMLYL